jgi:hypothetical protein
MDSVEAARAWRMAQHDMSRTVEGRIDRPQVSLAPRGAASADQAVPPGGDDEPALDADTEEYRRHRATRERIRAEREQLELERDRGELVALADVKRLVFTGFRTLRDRAFYIPDRVVGLTEAQKETLEAELAAVFSIEPETLMRESDDDEVDEDASV